MSAAKLRGPSIVLALALMSGVLVLGQDPLVRTPPAPGPHPLQSLGRPVATATAERPGFDVLVWRRDFATLSSAEYRNAGKGTDVVLQGRADAMEALLAIDADTSPSSILLSLAADRGLALGVDGAATGLVAGVPVRVSASFYQSRDGALVKVPGGFVVSGTQIALWAERGAARESLIVSVRATFGTNPEATSAVAAFGTPQLTATLQVDADGNAVASPGDTLRYQLRIPNVGDAAMTNVVANLPLDANTAAVAGSLNVSPIALDQTVTINEDTPAPITLTGSDADGNALTYTVVTQPAHGGVVQAAPGSAGVTYTPAVNFNGTDTFTVRNNDGRVDSNETATITVTVGPVNDAPSFTKGADQSVVENSPAQSVPGWATAISPGPADEIAQTITFEITNNTAPALFSVAPAVSPSGTLTYTPAPTFSGTATISIRARDSGGTGNGGVDVSPIVTFTIEIRSVNEAPSFTKGADPTVLEDSGAQTVAGWATAISPGVNEITQTVTFEVTNNTNTALFAAGPAVASNGTLTFTPAANANGTATITLRARDDGGTADGGVDVSATQTFVINVTAVNDAPSFTKGADVTALEDSGANTVAGWATAISKGGGADESGQTLTFVVTNNTNPALFATGPAVNAANGNLTFTPAANVFGAATITLRLDDNGGGANQSPTQTFDITVTNVNDAPSFTKGADQTVLEDAGPQTVNPWATAISAGPNEGTQTVAFAITNNTNSALFSVQPAVSPAGVLTYTPAANANGSATVTLRLTDNGGTADLGVDTSATQTFVINVTAVNDNPVADDEAYGVLEGATLNVPAPGVLDGDTDVEGTTLAAQLVTGPAHASSFTLNPDGSFSYTHNGSETPLTDTFTYRASDGVLTSNLATVTITITPVNDAPIAVNDAYGVNEGATLTVPLPGVLGNDSDAEGTALTAVLVTGPAHAATFTLNPNGSFSYAHNGSETTTDTFTYRASDGVAASNIATVTITITPVNDPPVIDLDGTTPGGNYAFTFTEGDPATFLENAANAALTDADSPTLTSLKVTLTNRLDPGFEVLDVDLVTGGFDTNFTKDYDVTTNPAQGVLTIASATPQPIADYITLLRRVTYSNTDLAPDPANRIVTFVANDGTSDSAAATTTVTVVSLNTPPTVTAGATLGYTENQAATAIDGGLTVADPDNSSLVSATVQITGNYASGQDVLGFVDQPGITGLWDSGSGTLTLTGSALVADYQTALRTVTYVNGSDNPSTLTRTVTWIVNDGTDPSAPATSTVTVAAVNDNPVADADSYGVNEGGTLTVPAPGVLDGDTDAEGTPLTAVLVTGPAHASSFTLNPDGSFSYTHDGSETLTDTFTYRASDGALLSNTATVTIAITPINDAPVAGDNAYGVNEGATLTQVAPGVLAGDTDAELNPLTAVLVTGPAHASSFTLNPDGSFSYTHDGSETPLSDTFTYRASDGVALSNLATVTITIAPVNDPPVINLDADDSSGAAGGNYKFTFTEADPTTFLADTTDAAITDADTATLTSLKITLTNRLDPGFEVLDVDLVTGGFDANFTKDYDITTNPAQGVLTIASAVPQPIADYITLLRRVTYSNTDAGPNPADRIVTFVANDGTSNSAPATTTITVITQNQAPTAADDSYGVNEGATLAPVAPGVLAGDTDPDGDTLTAVLVTGPAHASSFTLNPDGSFTYVHDGNGFAADSFTYRANDGLTDSNVATVTITVTSVNDAPTFVKGADVTVLEDSGAHTTIGWATAMNPGGAEEAGQVLTFVVTNDTNPALFSVAPVVNATTGTLTFTPAANAFGSATITLRLDDDGGIANGGVNQSATQTFVINVTGVNDAPSFTKGADQTVLEDSGLHSVSAWATAISAGPNEGAQTVAFEITGNTNGGLFSVAPAVSPTGVLTYTPAPDANGTAAITLRITDNGGTSDGGVDVSATQTFNVTVTAVNDAPSFTKGADVTVLEDSGASSTAGWATAISAGPADESTQVTTFVVTGNTNAALFSAAPAVDAITGNLTFTPAANAFGSATITLRLDDNGGVLNGGANQSPTQTFVITVTGVNDAPSFTKGADQTLLEDATAVTVNGWATGISAGPGEGGQTVSFAITNNTNPALFSAGPAVSPTGVLTYTPAANENGSATITLRITDNGGTSDGGVDVSATQTFNVTVTAVNDAPSYTAGAAQTVLEDSGAQTVPGWATGMSPGPANESTQTLSFNVTNNTVPATLTFSAGPTVDPITGTLTYTPAANAHGSGTFNVILSDDGGTANAGVNSVTHILTINVTPVNDAPTFTPGANQTANEDANAVSISNFVTAITSGPNETGQTVTFTITGNTNASLFSVAPAISSAGTLTYTTASNKNGVTTISYHASDNGGIANGGIDTTSPDQSFTITLNPVNDAPVAAAKAFTALANFQTAQSISLAADGSGDVTDADNADVGFTTQDFTLTSVTPLGCPLCVTAVTDGNLGTYTFEPPPGQTGTFLLQYVVTDNGNPTPGVPSVPGTLTGQPGVITVTVNGPVVWFVDSTAPGGGNGIWTGTNAKAFQTIAQVDAVNIAGDRVFVINNNASPISYAGGLTMTPTERLIGQGVTGVSFDAVVLGGAPPAGTAARPGINGVRPTLQGTTTLENGVTITGVNFTPNAAVPAMSSPGLATTAPITIDQVNVTGTGGGTRAVSLTNVTATAAGALNVSNATFSNLSGAELFVSGGNVPITINASVTITSNAGRSIDIQDRTGGTILFNTGITDTGQGIFLDDNASTTITFNGALALSTGVNPAFTATDGGTITTNSGVINTIATSTGQPLLVRAITGPQTWRSINVTGSAANGISVTSLTGAFTITGNGSAGTGGTITNVTNRGAEFITVSGAVTLNWMNFTNAGSSDGSGGPGCQEPIGGNTATCNAAIFLSSTSGNVSLQNIHVDGGAQVGINGLNVTNLTMNNVEVENVGNDSLENGVLLKNTFGTGTIANSTFHNNTGKQVYMYNNTGTLTSFNITNSNFSDTAAPNGAQGLLVYADGAATVMTVNTGTGAGTGNTFNNLFSFAWQALAANSAQLTANLRNAVLTNTNSMVVQASLNSHITTTIDSNNWTAGANTAAGPIALKTDGDGDMNATVTNNLLGQNGVPFSGMPSTCGNCVALFINPRFNSDSDFDIRGNTFQGFQGQAIYVQPGETDQANAVRATITGNLIRQPSATSTIPVVEFRNGVSSGPPSDNSCLQLTFGGSNAVASPSLSAGAKNTIDGVWSSSGAEVFLWRRFNTVFNLVGLPAPTTSLATFIGNNNNLTGGATATSLSDSSVNFGNGTCTP